MGNLPGGFELLIAPLIILLLVLLVVRTRR